MIELRFAANHEAPLATREEAFNDSSRGFKALLAAIITVIIAEDVRMGCAAGSPPLTFQPFLFPRFMSAFQKSATKPHTYAIMTPESPGAEYTSATWNSARARPGKSSAKESATQVRLGAFVGLNELRVPY